MATAPQLPLFFNDLVPLSTQQHADWKLQPQDKAPFMVGNHAVPITVDEFIVAGRVYPIVFSAGDNSVPIILMGLNEGMNMYVNDDGTLKQPVYVPAYVRRYPFLLAKLRNDSDELSLCFDPTANGIGADVDGEPLFADGQPSEITQNILKFCEQFEQSGAQTAKFMEDLNKLGILIDGEVQIQPEGSEQPFIYRGFKMVDEAKLRDLRGDELRKMAQNGMLPLIYAHLFSLQIISQIFQAQVASGKMPAPAPAAVN